MVAEIARRWKFESRRAEVWVVIGKLMMAKELKRENVKGERGSRYTAVRGIDRRAGYDASGKRTSRGSRRSL